MEEIHLPPRINWLSRLILAVASASFLLGGLFAYARPSANPWVFYGCFIASLALLLGALFAPVRLRAAIVSWL